MKHKLLSKSLLMAVGLFVGASTAWADNANLTPTADTYFNWNSDEAKVTSYGTETTLYCGIWQEYWTNAVPGLKANSDGANIAVFKFDVSDYKGKITAATFKVTGTNPSSNTNTRSIYLGYFDLTNWDESSTANTSEMTTRAASGLNIHPFSLSQSIAKGQTNEVSFSNDALLSYLNEDEDGIVSLVIYGLGQQCSVNSKEAESGKPSLVLTYTNETLYTAEFTANEGAITPTVTIYSDEERETPVTNGTLTNGTTYYYRAVLTGYFNSEGSFTVDGADPSVSFTMTAKTTFTYSVNAVDSEDKIIKATIASDTKYEDETASVAWSKYINVDGRWYVTDETTFTTTATEAGIKKVVYSPAAITYFFEVEDMTTNRGNQVQKTGSKYSGGITQRHYGADKGRTSYYYTPALNGGIYTVSIPVEMANASGTELSLRTRTAGGVVSDPIVTETFNTNKTYTFEGIEIPQGSSLVIYSANEYNSNALMDYVYIVKTAEIVSVSAAGYATLYSEYALTIPTGVKAYTGTVSGNKLVLSEVETTIPANTAVVLQAEKEDTYSFEVTTADAFSGENHLAGGTGETAAAGDLVLGIEDSVVGFYGYKGVLATNKAYLPASKVSNAPAIYFSFEDETEVTGVYNLRVEEKANAAFDLTGRRANGKGLMIQNGKVVLVK